MRLHSLQMRILLYNVDSCILTYPHHPNVGHKATMSLLHRWRSWAITWASSIVRPMSESSVVMVLLHVVFRRHLLRFPVGIHLRATFGIDYCGIRRTWPNHLNLCLCIWGLIGDEFVLLYRSSLDILYCQNMLQVLRRHLVWNTSSLFI